jgi:hypothetical protein
MLTLKPVKENTSFGEYCGLSFILVRKLNRTPQGPLRETLREPKVFVQTTQGAGETYEVLKTS